MQNNHIEEEKIVDYVLDQLPQEEFFQVHTHIQNCSHCSTLANTWAKTFNNKTSKEKLTSLNERVFTAIHKKKQKRKYRNTYLAIATSLLLVLGFSMFQINNSNQINETDHYTFNEQERPIKEKDLLKYFKIIVDDSPKLHNRQYSTKKDYLQLLGSQYTSNSQLKDHFFLRQDGSLCKINPTQQFIDCYTLIIDKNDRIKPFKRETYRYLNH